MFKTTEILKALRAHASSSQSLNYGGVSHHSQKIKEGELFVALKGETFDGHQFLKEVFERGALGAVVRKGRVEVHSFKGKQLFEVADTLTALGDLAQFHRRRFSIPVLGITGSNGKTTTKDLMAQVLSQKCMVLKTEGNLNNLIGLPMTLFRLNATHQVAVIEMGMSLPFEMKRLASILEPTLGLITNIGKTHLETMNSEKSVARYKTDLFRALKKNGTAFLNRDDLLLKKYQKKLSCHVRTYSLQSKDSDVFGEVIEALGAKGQRIRCRSQEPFLEVEFQLPLPGIHNAMNALASFSVASFFKLSPDQICKGFESFTASESRTQIHHLKQGICLIDDSYNANPTSMACALELLKKIASERRTYAVLGDMLALGDQAVAHHKQIAEIINEKSIDNLLTLGPLAQYYKSVTKKNKKMHIFSTLDQSALIEELIRELKAFPGVVLVKGSRGMQMDRVVDALKRQF